MINTIIGEIYNSLGEDELRQLNQYILTSNWQYSETIVRCHDCFQHYKLSGQLEVLNKQIIFKTVYEEEDYNDGKLRFLFNRLLEAIREFILLYSDRKENVFTEKVWMDFLLDKKLRKNIQNNLEKKEIASSSEYKFLLRYFKSQEQNIHSFTFKKDIKFQFNTMTELMRNAEIFSDLVFIKNYCSLVTFTNVYQSVPLELPTDKLNQIKEKKLEVDYPEFYVYLSLIDLLTNKNSKEYYQKYKLALFENFDLWNSEEKDNLIVYLINFTASQINSGDVSYIDEQYELFNMFLSKNVFFTKDHINQGRINNTVFIYLRKKEYREAENFVNQYVSLLNADSQDSCRHFNLARIHFENMRYKESLRELLQVDFSHDPGYSLNSKLLLLKNYFELKESDAFDSLCLSFKEFIRKNKVISNNNKLYLSNFIKMTRRLYQAPAPKLNRIAKELKNATQIAEKNWLTEKANTVKK